MKLLVTSLGSVAVEVDDVVSVRAEDASGGFGILPGHADFLTALDASVVSWRHRDGLAIKLRSGAATLGNVQIVTSRGSPRCRSQKHARAGL